MMTGNTSDTTAYKTRLADIRDEFEKADVDEVVQLSEFDIQVSGTGDYGHKQRASLVPDPSTQCWIVILEDGDLRRERRYGDDLEAAIEFLRSAVENIESGQTVYPTRAQSGDSR